MPTAGHPSEPDCVVAVCGIWTYKLEKDHAAHEEHLKHENDGKLPQPPAYEYLNVRRMCFAHGI